MKKVFYTLCFSLSVLTAFAGDVLTLSNQKMFDGKVIKISGCSIVFVADGHKHSIPASDIFSVQFENENDKVYTDYLKMLENNPNHCLSGSLDAENFHGKKGGHFVLGVLFGPFAIIGTALADPTPDKGKSTYMLSKNKELFNDPEYLSCYRKKAKTQLMTMEALGWGAWLLFGLLL